MLDVNGSVRENAAEVADLREKGHDWLVEETREGF